MILPRKSYILVYHPSYLHSKVLKQARHVKKITLTVKTLQSCDTLFLLSIIHNSNLSQICLRASFCQCVLLPARRGCCHFAVLLAWRRGALVGGQSQNRSQWEWQVAPRLPDIIAVLVLSVQETDGNKDVRKVFFRIEVSIMSLIERINKTALNKTCLYQHAK